MSPAGSPRVGYVLKVFPRLSQTFILNEILAHQEAGSPVDIFSLRHPGEGPFHQALARVASRPTYFPAADLDADALGSVAGRAASSFPALWDTLNDAKSESARAVAQSIQVASAVRERGIDHLHAHFGNVATTVARLAASIAGISYSFTAHARDIFHERVRPGDLRRKLTDASNVVTVSRFNVDYLKEYYDGAARRVELVYNGLDLDALPYVAPVKRERLIVGIGRLVAKKGFTDLIDACANLARDGKSFRCEIVGSGPLEEALRARVIELGLRDRVKLVGPRSGEDVAGHIRRASVLAAPCVIAEDGDRDGLPTVLLEAMALGTPCVATAVTGIPEAVSDGRTGLLVPQRSPRELARACSRLMDEPDLRLALSRAGRELVEQRFDVRRNAARLRDIFFRAVVARRSARRSGVQA